LAAAKQQFLSWQPDISKQLACKMIALQPVEAIAAQYGITLPAPEELPPSYTSVRMWLTRRVATLQGRHKQAWENTKRDPDKLQRARQANRARVDAYQSRQKAQRDNQGTGST